MNLFLLSRNKLTIMFFIVLACFALITFIPLSSVALSTAPNRWYDPLPIAIIFFFSYLIACFLSAYLDQVIKVQNFFAPTILKVLMTTILIPLVAFFVVNQTFLGSWIASFLFDQENLPQQTSPGIASYLFLTDIAICIIFVSYGAARFIDYRVAQLGKKKKQT